jgi:hypothetical protein
MLGVCTSRLEEGVLTVGEEWMHPMLHKKKEKDQHFGRKMGNIRRTYTVSANPKKIDMASPTAI